MKQKLDTLLISQTEFSRREILDLLTDKKITINGQVVQSLTHVTDPAKDTIKINGKTISTHLRFFYYKFHKPKGIISTLEDPRGRPTLKEFMKDLPVSVFPIGRLDRDTSGLLLFSNDGQFAQQISHPKFKITKLYKVTVDKSLTERHTERLLSGMLLDDGPAKFSKIELISEISCYATISEGRNHIVRRLFQQLGYTVIKLKRLAIGPIQLDKLAEGKFKELKIAELKAILQQSRDLADR